MRFSLTRFTSIALLVILFVLLLTGVYGLFFTLNGWVWDVHRAAGWLLVAALPFKTAVAARSLKAKLKQRRFSFSVWISLGLALLAVAVILLGMLWNWRLGPSEYPLRQTAVAWHWMIGLGLAAPFLVHVWQRWVLPRRVDFTSRRALLRWGVLAAGGLVAWQGAEAIARIRRSRPEIVRVSGSRLSARDSGNDFPVTHALAASFAQVQPSVWSLSVSGRVASPLRFSYERLLALPRVTQDATLDCTLGWYALQNWSGMSLARLLDAAGLQPDARNVRLASVTGYSKALPLEEARGIILATHVSGQPLSLEHGYPLRAVVPSRRGWFWVKWLTRVEVLDTESLDEIV